MPVESEVASQSMLAWMLSSLGWIYLILLPLSALLSFLFALLIVIRGRGPLAGGALVLVVHVSFLIGIFAALQGTLASYQIIATSDSTPRPSDLAAGISTALIAPLVAMLLSVPAYATAALGGLIRCLKASAE